MSGLKKMTSDWLLDNIHKNFFPRIYSICSLSKEIFGQKRRHLFKYSTSVPSLPEIIADIFDHF